MEKGVHALANHGIEHEIFKLLRREHDEQEEGKIY